MNNKEIFTKIYNTNHWGSKESVSGPGSEEIQTRKLRYALPKLITKFNIKTILDAPCGDFNWMNILKIYNYVDFYYGYDIVDKIIHDNVIKYSNIKKLEFKCNDIAYCILPKVDLIICRDCLVHLCLNDILLVIKNFVKTKSKYLLVTNYHNVTSNCDTSNGHWRPINLQLSPFNLGKPILSIDDEYTADGSYSGKKMDLFDIEKIDIN